MAWIGMRRSWRVVHNKSRSWRSGRRFSGEAQTLSFLTFESIDLAMSLALSSPKALARIRP